MILTNYNHQILFHQNNHDTQEYYNFLNGYSKRNFEYIVFKLDYNIKTVLMNDNYNDNKISSLYEVTDDLRSGTFGQVKLFIHKKTCDKVAVKYISRKNNSIELQLITSEMESLKTLSTHNNIINVLITQYIQIKYYYILNIVNMVIYVHY